MMLFISRSLKRLNKVTKSMYIFIMDLTLPMHFNQFMLFLHQGLSEEIKDFLVFIAFYTVLQVLIMLM